MSRTRLGIDAVVALTLFGCIPVAVRAISANPFTIGVVRLAVASAVFFLVMRWVTKGPSFPRERADVLRLGVIGFLFFGHWLTFFLSIKASSASIAAIGLSTYGIFLILFGAIFARNPLRPVEVGAVIVAAAGAVIVVPKLDLSNQVMIGMLLSGVSAMFYAALPILHQRWSHVATSSRALGQFSFALLFFLLLLPWTEWDLTRRDWYGLLFLAIGPTLIGHTLWVRVTTAIPLSLTSVIYYGNIPVAVLLSVLLLDEPLSPRTVVGASMIIGGGAAGLLSRWRVESSRTAVADGEG